MDKEIRILIVEDNAADAELIARELGKGDFVLTTKWVKSREEYLKALQEFVPDIILCDYRMPELGASEALKIVKERLLKTPFIVVSGTVGDEIALEMMKLGAADYVMKDKLAMLIPVIEREVVGIFKEKEVRKHSWDCVIAETRTTPVFMAVSEALSILIFFAGCGVLVGWALDIPALKSILPGLVTMKANTALCFVFLGLSLWLLQIKRRDNPLCQGAARVSSSVVLGIGLLTLSEYLFGWNLGIDQLLFKELPGAIHTSSPGRMAFNTAINFTITGLALFLLASKPKNRCFLTQILIIPTGIIAILSIVGYLYHADPLFIGLHFSTAMALHTAVLFFVVFVGVLFCRPGCGLMTVVSSDFSGGTLARRLLPFTVLVPLTLGWLMILMEKAQIGSPALGVSFVATGNLVLISMCVYILAFFLNRWNSGQRQAQEALVSSNIILQTQQESSLDGILVVDEKGGIISFNQRFIDMWGIPIDVIESKSDKRALQVVLDKLASSEEFLRKVKHLYETEAEICRDEIVLKDGRIFDRYSSPMVGKDGKRYGRVWYFRDITERQRMAEALKRSHESLEVLVKERTKQLELANKELIATGWELKRASAAKSEFLANMSHELRTPLASIIGFSEVIFDEKFGALNERQKEYAENVLTSGQHLLSLINDILDLSKVEAGKMVLEASFFSVKNCLEEVLSLTAGLAFSKNIDPVVEIPDDLGEIRADLRKVKQVVFNLVSNAIKFTPAGGKIGLRARRDDAGIEIAVWDTGVGIPSENLETVFEAFTRLVDTYTQETEGTGLGLTISRKIVEFHAGKIWIESEGAGKGTAVKFTIPARGI